MIINGDINQSIQHSNTLISSWPVPELTSVQPITTPNSRLQQATDSYKPTLISIAVNMVLLDITEVLKQYITYK